MLHHRLMLHSPAFLLLALLNVVLVLWGMHSDPTRAAVDSTVEGLHTHDDSPNALLAGMLERDSSRRSRRPKISPSKGRGSTQEQSAVGDIGTRSCEVCVVDPDNERCQYGLDNVRLSRAYQGSGHRVRRVLEKALRGEVVKVGILGGSVSTGHGLYGTAPWTMRWFEGFKKHFPTAELQNGASAACGSNFFSFCWESLIDTDLDLYLIEVDINNESAFHSLKGDDALFRGILDLPQQPAIIRLSVVSPAFDDLGQGFPSDLTISNYFDVPIISIRNFLLPHLIKHPEVIGEFFAGGPDLLLDTRHIGEHGHQALSDMLTLYIDEQICETRRRVARKPVEAKAPWPTDDILGMVPRLYYWNAYDDKFVAPPVHPHCTFATSPRAPLSPLKDPKLTTPSAWKRVEWNDKAALVATTPGDRIAFAFSGSKVGLFMWHQNGEKKPADEPQPGTITCWVDNDLIHATERDTHWDYPHGLSEWVLVREGLEVGPHILHCQISRQTSTGGHEIRITGVAST